MLANHSRSLLMLLPLLSACAGPAAIDTTPGTTYGQILVSSPTVDTRERLISDRMEQYDWLYAQLKDSDKAVFGANGTRQRKSSNFFGSTTNLNVDPSGAALSAATQAAKLAELGRQQSLAELDFQVALTQKKLVLKNAQSTTEPDRITLPAAGSPTKDASSIVPAKVGAEDVKANSDAFKALVDATVGTLAAGDGAAVQASPIDAFRDRLALREEIRNEMIANSLDDRHDLRGNALYRLSFDATVLPANDTSSYAVISVCIQRPLDSLYSPPSLARPSLSRAPPSIARCDIASRQDADNNFSESDDAILKRALGSFFLAGMSALSDDFDANASAFVRTGNSSTLRQHTQDLLYKGNRALKVLDDLDKDVAFSSYVAALGAKTRSIQSRTFDADLRALFASTAGSKDTAENRLCAAVRRSPDEKDLIKGVLRASLIDLQIACGPNEQSVNILAVNKAIAALGLAVDVKDKLYQSRKMDTSERDFFQFFNNCSAGVDGPQCRIPEIDRYAPLIYHDGTLDIDLNMAAVVKVALARQALELYAYGATPKESVQRISDVVTRREGVQLALGLQALAGNTGIASLTNWMQANEGIFNALRRQPLVVGFGHSNAQQKDNPDGMPPADFGWIIGPRYGAADNGKQANFRQAVVQNGLSAIISVPGWWDQVELVVRRYWVNESGKVLRVDARRQWLPFTRNNDYDDATAIRYKLALPGQDADIFNILNPGQLMEVDGERTDVPAWSLKYGARAEVVIRGSNLWRNPQVRLGAQIADRVKVMPDMAGVVAIFDNVDKLTFGGPDVPFLKKAPADSLPLTIATPNGYKLVGFAKVTEDKPPATKLRADGSAILIGHASNAITLNQPLGGYAGIKGQYRKAGTNKAFVTDQAAVGRKKDTELTYQAGALTGLTLGDSVELQLLLTYVPGEEPDRLAVSGPLVYYPTAADWHVGVTASKPKDSDGSSIYVITLTFPKGYEDALGIKDGKASFDVIGNNAPDTVDCKIEKSSCNVVVMLRAPQALNQVSLKPHNLGATTPSPFCGNLAEPSCGKSSTANKTAKATPKMSAKTKSQG